jgi:hypothetical protein
LRAAERDFVRLTAAAPDDSSYRAKAAATLQLLAQVLFVAGRPSEAQPFAARAHDMAESLVRQDPTVTEWSGPRLANARLLSFRLAAALAPTAAAQRDALQPATAEAERLANLSSARPGNLPLLRSASEADLLAGDHARLRGDPATALRLWRRAAGRLDRPLIAALPASDRARLVQEQIRQRLGRGWRGARSYAW